MMVIVMSTNENISIEGLLAITLYPLTIILIAIVASHALTCTLLSVPYNRIPAPHTSVLTALASVALALEIASLISYSMVKISRLLKGEDIIIDPHEDGYFITMIILASIAIMYLTIVAKIPLLNSIFLLELLTIVGVPLFGITLYFTSFNTNTNFVKT